MAHQRQQCRQGPLAASAQFPGWVSSWYGIGAPKSTPEEIVERLNTAINASIADPKFQARLANLGGTVLPGSPTDFGKLISDVGQGDPGRQYQAAVSRRQRHSITFR
jgi:Tripartite tricarboxylate transporter family receptor